MFVIALQHEHVDPCFTIISDYCSWEVFSPSCSDDEILVIDKALYGLMSSGRCVDEGYSQYIGCSADMQGYLDKECSGIRSCELNVYNKDLKDSIHGTCPEPYLEVNYRCQKGMYCFFHSSL